MTNDNEEPSAASAGSIAWRDVTEDHLRVDGGERWLRVIDDGCWISVLHRMTGFGYMEWETAIVFLIADGSRPKRWASDDRDVLIIRGDWRDKLAEMPKWRLRGWYEENICGNRNSIETVIEALKQ